MITEACPSNKMKERKLTKKKEIIASRKRQQIENIVD